MKWSDIPSRDRMSMSLGILMFVVIVGLTLWIRRGTSDGMHDVTDAVVSEIRKERDESLEKLRKELKEEMKKQDEVALQTATNAAVRADTAEVKANVAERRIDRTEQKTDGIVKDLTKIKKPLKPFIDHPKVVEKIVKEVAPLAPDTPIVFPTPEMMAPVEPDNRHKGLLNFLFGK